MTFLRSRRQCRDLEPSSVAPEPRASPSCWASCRGCQRLGGCGVSPGSRARSFRGKVSSQPGRWCHSQRGPRGQVTVPVGGAAEDVSAREAPKANISH